MHDGAVGPVVDSQCIESSLNGSKTVSLYCATPALQQLAYFQSTLISSFGKVFRPSVHVGRT